jgi:hypothetical protein
MDNALQTTDDDSIDFKAILAWVATLGLGILGALLGGCVGYLAGAGLTTLIAASIGFGVMFLCGFCVMGPAKAIVDKSYAEYAPPDTGRMNLGLSNKTFSLHVTVHNLRNLISTEGIAGFFGKKNDSFVEIKCGRQLDEDSDFYPGKNPPKRTCVSQSNTFDETFNIMVAPRDNKIVVSVYDQDVVGDDLVGAATIDITQEILNAGFPQKLGFKLVRQEGLVFGTNKKKTGTVILSFFPGDGFPQRSKDKIKETKPLEWKRLEEAQSDTIKESLAKYGKTSYGTIIRDGTLMTKNHASNMTHMGGVQSATMLNAGTGSATQLQVPGTDTQV